MKKATKRIRYSVSNKVIPPEIFEKYYATMGMGSQTSEEKKQSISDLCRAIGKKFYAARMAKGMSLEELSEKAEIPLLVLEDLEAGHTLLAVHIQPYIAQYLDITMKQVYEGIDWKK